MKTILTVIAIVSLAWIAGIEAAKYLNKQEAERAYQAQRHGAELVVFPVPGELASR